MKKSVRHQHPNLKAGQRDEDLGASADKQRGCRKRFRRPEYMMNILTGLNAASGLLNGAAKFVQTLKQPELTDQAFSDLFIARLNAEASPESQEARALEMSRNFIALRDVNGDKMLRMDESGLTQAQFEALDRNGDGQLSTSELQAGMLAGEQS